MGKCGCWTPEGQQPFLLDFAGSLMKALFVRILKNKNQQEKSAPR
jgi:hypothetical protein